jgi:hypothetical protein
VRVLVLFVLFVLLIGHRDDASYYGELEERFCVKTGSLIFKGKPRRRTSPLLLDIR